MAGEHGRTIDMHAHVFTPSCQKLVEGLMAPEMEPFSYWAGKETNEYQVKHTQAIFPKLTDVSVRLADMDAMGIDVQAISTSPLQYYYGVDPDIGRKSSRAINERLAEVAASNPDRFVALGTAPMQDGQAAVSELEHCMKKLGFRGMEIGTNVAGVEIADKRFERFWRRAEELGAVVFLHPIGFTEPSRLTQHFLTNIIGNPLDTTVALAHIVFGGVLERYPKLKIVAAHGGGYMGHYPARMDHAYKVRPECHDHISRPPSHYLKKIYYDTMVFDRKQLEHLVNVWGADHVVIGTDYPYDMGYYKPVELVEGTASLSRAEKNAIIGGNAAKLLGLRRGA